MNHSTIFDYFFSPFSFPSSLLRAPGITVFPIFLSVPSLPDPLSGIL
jgi:hypothetical protein